MNTQPKHTSLDSLVFDNRFIEELPCDSQTDNYRRQVSGACYSLVLPTPVAKPQHVAYSKEAAALLDLSEELCSSEDFVQVFTEIVLQKA